MSLIKRALLFVFCLLQTFGALAEKVSPTEISFGKLSINLLPPGRSGYRLLTRLMFGFKFVIGRYFEFQGELGTRKGLSRLLDRDLLRQDGSCPDRCPGPRETDRTKPRSVKASPGSGVGVIWIAPSTGSKEGSLSSRLKELIARVLQAQISPRLRFRLVGDSISRRSSARR